MAFLPFVVPMPLSSLSILVINRFQHRSLLFGISLGLLGVVAAGSPVEVTQRVILAPVFEIKDTYRSMMGPSATQDFVLAETEKPELLWIVGFKAEMVDAKGREVRSQEFMCHSNLDVDISAYRRVFDWRKNSSRRLFTLSQGQYEINFPEGFGIPMVSWQPLRLNSQVLNLNHPGLRTKVRHRITVSYVRDTDLKREMTPLFMKAAQAMVALDEDSTHWGTARPDEEEHGESCMIGTAVRGDGREDKFGQRFSGHWVVPPGEHEYRALVTKWLNLPFDTTAHYIAVHLHPFAQWIQLYDLTEDRVVFHADATNPLTGIGLDHVEFLADAQGLNLNRRHQYQIRTRYHNTSGVDQDSMAVMFFYIKDQEFEKPTPQELASRLHHDSNLRDLEWVKKPMGIEDVIQRGRSPARM